MAMFQIKERTSQKVTASSRKQEKTFITQITRKQMEYSHWMIKESLTKGLSNNYEQGLGKLNGSAGSRDQEQGAISMPRPEGGTEGRGYRQ